MKTQIKTTNLRSSVIPASARKARRFDGVQRRRAERREGRVDALGLHEPDQYEDIVPAWASEEAFA